MIRSWLFVPGDDATGVLVEETDGGTLVSATGLTDSYSMRLTKAPQDEVVIYSGATVLGRITVGKGSVIGGNVWLTETVPPGSRVSQSKPRQEKFQAGSGI